MTLNLNFPPDIEAGLLAQAKLEGIDVSLYVQRLVQIHIEEKLARDPESIPAYERLSPEEWIREFREWAESHRGRNFPILSDEDISRESLYADRGL